MQAISVSDFKRISALPKTIDWSSRDKLFYLGKYYREMDVSMDRMMENALDWEHLPHLHNSSFADLDKLEAGNWGWRAHLELPPKGSDNTQVVQLLLDSEKHYWVSTILTGFGEGSEIHTQAEVISAPGEEERISVTVEFFFPIEPSSEEEKEGLFSYIKTQYALLYDEDFAMMKGRQDALLAQQTESVNKAEAICLGKPEQLSLPMTVDFEGQSICIREFEGKLVAHAALCPHLLGPLDQADCVQGNELVCPWHGYRFDLATGKSTQGKKIHVAQAVTVELDQASHEVWLRKATD